MDDVEATIRSLAEVRPSPTTAVGLGVYLLLMVEAYLHAVGQAGVIGLLIEGVPGLDTLPYRWVFWLTLAVEGVLFAVSLRWLIGSRWQSNLGRELRALAGGIRSWWKGGAGSRRAAAASRSDLTGRDAWRLAFCLLAASLLIVKLAAEASLWRLSPLLTLLLAPAVAAVLGWVLAALIGTLRRDRHSAAAVIVVIGITFALSFYAPSFTAAFSRASCLTDETLQSALRGQASGQTQAAMASLYGLTQIETSSETAFSPADDACQSPDGTRIDFAAAPRLRAIDPELTDLRLHQITLLLGLLGCLVFTMFRNKTERLVIEVTGSGTGGSKAPYAVWNPADYHFPDPVAVKFKFQGAAFAAFERPPQQARYHAVSTTDPAVRVFVDESDLVIWNLAALDSRLDQTRQAGNIRFFEGELSYAGRNLPALMKAFGTLDFTAEELAVIQALMVPRDESLAVAMHEEFQATLREALSKVQEELAKVRLAISESEETDLSPTLMDNIEFINTYAVLRREEQDLIRQCSRVARFAGLKPTLQRAVDQGEKLCEDLTDPGAIPDWPATVSLGRTTPPTPPTPPTLAERWTERMALRLTTRASDAGKRSSVGLTTLWRVIGPEARANLRLGQSASEMRSNLDQLHREAEAKRDQAAAALTKRLAEAGAANTLTLAEQIKAIIDLVSNPRIPLNRVQEAIRQLQNIAQPGRGERKERRSKQAQLTSRPAKPPRPRRRRDQEP